MQEPMTWYVSPSGLADNDGTLAYPWTLAKALSNPAGIIHAGDTILMHGGTYSGNIAPSLIGTEANPIVFKPYNFESPVIDGIPTMGGQYINWMDIEFMYSGWQDRTANGNPSREFAVSTVGGKLINCVIHDFYNFAFWSNSKLLYGCLIFNNGIKPIGAPEGHSLYTQNDSVVNRKTIKHNIMLPSFNYNYHAYGSQPILGFDLTENVFIGDVCLHGGEGIDDDVTLDGDLGYNTYFQFGYSNLDHLQMSIQNIYFHNKNSGAFGIHKWKIIDLQDSVISGDNNLLGWKDAASPVSQVINNNTYHGTDASPFVDDGVDKTFVEWKGLGFDADSSLSASNPPDVVFVRVNEFSSISSLKGYIAIFNYTQAESVSVDLSSLSLESGRYNLINAQDPTNDITSFDFSGENLIIDMRVANHTIAKPIGHATELLETTFPIFGCFVIRKVS